MKVKVEIKVTEYFTAEVEVDDTELAEWIDEPGRRPDASDVKHFLEAGSLGDDLPSRRDWVPSYEGDIEIESVTI